jgi:hypothetical protein
MYSAVFFPGPPTMTKKLSNRHAIVEFCPPKAWIGSWVLVEQDTSVISLNDTTPVATATRMAIVSGSFLSLLRT